MPDPDPTPVLSVRGLRKRFVLHAIGGREVEALRGVDLDVAAGEHVALAGNSGAGKSTVLRCVHRTYLPTAGSIVVDTAAGAVDLATASEREVLALREQALGYVSQFLRAEPRRGPLDLVARAAVRRGMDRSTATEAAAQALRKLNIDEQLWAVYANVLSGGEKQRVNLAAGTVCPPRVLLLDEPVSALDPANRDAALEMIAELTHLGVAVLSVFHDLDAMERLATRVIVMRDGEIADQGDPRTVLGRLVGVAR